MTLSLHPLTCTVISLKPTVTKADIAAYAWEQSKASVRISDEVRAVIGDQSPDTVEDSPWRVWYGTSWLEDQSWAWLLFVFEQYVEMRNQKHKRFFRWYGPQEVGCWVWIDDGPQRVQRIVGADAKAKWRPDSSRDPMEDMGL